MDDPADSAVSPTTRQHRCDEGGEEWTTEPGTGVDVYPFADRIVDGLYLGDIKALAFLAQSDDNEQRRWRVVSLANDRSDIIACRALDAHMIIEATDDPATDLAAQFESAVRFIDDGLARGMQVLVHCMAGVSRSATIVAAYLIDRHRVGVKQALRLLTAARPQADPNLGFRAQLAQWAARA
jgi:hypothetical protein